MIVIGNVISTAKQCSHKAGHPMIESFEWVISTDMYVCVEERVCVCVNVCINEIYAFLYEIFIY